MERLLAKLLKLQAETSPIRLSIGYNTETNQVKHDAVIIYDCAPKIVTELVQDGGYFVQMVDGGLMVTVNPIKQ